ncbi:MAG: cold shock domain-containing protein [Maribacter sp.]|jgi:CspA family cold shock protein
MTGTVKFFNESKGYGFITNDETGNDIFVHATALNGVELKEGDKVEYVEEEGRKGMVAAQVQLTN